MTSNMPTVAEVEAIVGPDVGCGRAEVPWSEVAESVGELRWWTRRAGWSDWYLEGVVASRCGPDEWTIRAGRSRPVGLVGDFLARCGSVVEATRRTADRFSLAEVLELAPRLAVNETLRVFPVVPVDEIVLLSGFLPSVEKVESGW